MSAFPDATSPHWLILEGSLTEAVIIVPKPRSARPPTWVYFVSPTNRSCVGGNLRENMASHGYRIGHCVAPIHVVVKCVYMCVCMCVHVRVLLRELHQPTERPKHGVHNGCHDPPVARKGIACIYRRLRSANWFTRGCGDSLCPCLGRPDHRHPMQPAWNPQVLRFHVGPWQAPPDGSPAP